MGQEIEMCKNCKYGKKFTFKNHQTFAGVDFYQCEITDYVNKPEYKCDRWVDAE